MLLNVVKKCHGCLIIIFAVRLGMKTLTWPFYALQEFCYGLLTYLRYKCSMYIFSLNINKLRLSNSHTVSLFGRHELT